MEEPAPSNHQSAADARGSRTEQALGQVPGRPFASQHQQASAAAAPFEKGAFESAQQSSPELDEAVIVRIHPDPSDAGDDGGGGEELFAETPKDTRARVLAEAGRPGIRTTSGDLGTFASGTGMKEQHQGSLPSSLAGSGGGLMSSYSSIDDFLANSRWADSTRAGYAAAGPRDSRAASFEGGAPSSSTSLFGPSSYQAQHEALQASVGGPGGGGGRKFVFPSVTRQGSGLSGHRPTPGSSLQSSPRIEEEQVRPPGAPGELLKPEPVLKAEETAQVGVDAAPAPPPLQRGASIIPSVAVSVFGGGIYGYTTAIIAGLSGPLVNSTFYPNASGSTQSAMIGLLTASILIGGLVGTLMSMPLTARWGRRVALMVCGGICVAASVCMGVVQHFAALVALRAVLGLSVGMSSTLCPLYNAETVEPQRRGVVGAVYQLSIVTSILLAEVVNYAFNPSNASHVSRWVWQVQFILGGVFGAGLVVSAMIVPESKVWMESRRRKRAAKEAKREEARLLWARRLSRDGGQLAPGEEEHSTSVAPPVDPSQLKGWRGLFSLPNARWVGLAVLLASGNQLTGINAVIYYSPRIFTDAGYQNLALVLTISVVGSWNLISVLISMPLIRHWPRRTLMLWASGIMCAGMLLLAVATFFFSGQRAIPSILGILLVVLGFELGPGPLFFVLASEAFPVRILHASLSFANQAAWAFNIAVSFLFPLMNDALGGGATFAIFFLVNLITLLAYTAVLPKHAEHARITAPSASPPPVPSGEDDMAGVGKVRSPLRSPGHSPGVRGGAGGGNGSHEHMRVPQESPRAVRGASIELASPPAVGGGPGSAFHSRQQQYTEWLRSPGDAPPRRSTHSTSPPYQAAARAEDEAESGLATPIIKHPMQSPLHHSSPLQPTASKSEIISAEHQRV